MEVKSVKAIEHIIIGNGEIGKSIKEVLINPYRTDYQSPLRDIYIRDIEPKFMDQQFDIMHIAIRSDNQQAFIKTVMEYVDIYKPKLTIIHSSVDIGTMRYFYGLDPNMPMVHIPISGKHPDLTEDIRKHYALYVGGCEDEWISQGVGVFSDACANWPVGLIGNPPETTELMKLMSTTYYGWNIVFEKEMHKLCTELGVNPEIAYKHWNENYNRGMGFRGTHNFCRPVLDHMTGGIGGHCVIPNAELLRDRTGIARIILEKNEEYKQEAG